MVQENQGSDQPVNVKAKNGQTWWYQEPFYWKPVGRVGQQQLIPQDWTEASKIAMEERLQFVGYLYRCFLKHGVFWQRLVWIVAIEALVFSLLEIRFFPGRTTDNKIGGESLGPSFCIARWLETLQPLGRPCGKEVGVWLLCYHWYSCMITMALSNILSVFERLKRQWGRISVPRNTTTFLFTASRF